MPEAGAPLPDDDDLDDTGFMDRTCFVIMPFGKKFDRSTVPDASFKSKPDEPQMVQYLPGADVPVIDFNSIYDKLILPAVEDAAKITELKIECTRSDKAGRSGFIHGEMLELVASADIAIVDITTQNANVFYELGVRHSFRRATTILIQRQGTHIPFNIAGMRVFSYSDVMEPSEPNGKSPLENSKERLTQLIVASVNQKENDSLVHQLLPNASVVFEQWPIMEQQLVWYDVLNRNKLPIPMTLANGKSSRKSVGFITGDILDIQIVDVWVNPENTKMQMARFHDGSVSSNIRYYGARRSESGHILDDCVAVSLAQCMGDAASVEPGVVFATEAGTLSKTNNVKMIMHVAALQGEPGKGYQPIRDYPGCVRRVLAEIDRLNALPPGAMTPKKWGFGKSAPVTGPKLTGLSCETVVFPLFGTRTFGQHPQAVAERLYRAAVVYLTQNPASKIDTVYFLAYTTQDRELSERALAALATQKLIIPSRYTAGIKPAAPDAQVT